MGKIKAIRNEADYDAALPASMRSWKPNPVRLRATSSMS